MIKDFLAYYRPYKPHFIFVVLGSCVAALLDLIFPILVRHILNVELPQKNVEGILNWICLLMAMYFFNFGSAKIPKCKQIISKSCNLSSIFAAHNLKVVGSIPAPATNNYSASRPTGFFLALNPLVSEGFTTLPNSLCP